MRNEKENLPGVVVPSKLAAIALPVAPSQAHVGQPWRNAWTQRFLFQVIDNWVKAVNGTAFRPRLARSIGTGQSNVQHAREIGEIYGSQLLSSLVPFGFPGHPPPLSKSTLPIQSQECS